MVFHDDMNATATTKVFLNAKELPAVVGLSRVTIWRLETAGDFPKRRQLTSQRVGWLFEEVVEWARSRPTADPEEVPAGTGSAIGVDDPE